MTRRRLVPGALLGAAIAVTVGAVAPGAGAAEEPPFGSYRLAAAAHGYQLLVGDQIDGTAPDAFATFDTGQIGYGRASVAWPGALAANAGDLIILASAGQIPPEMEPTFRLLNDPVRAEARSPSGPPEASFDNVPGVTMRSSAGELGSSAQSNINRAESPGVGTFGSSSASSNTRLDPEAAVADGSSTVTDVSIAGGLIEIDSVVSSAVARSDGVAGSGDASTTVNGVTVAGQPATIDEHGLRLGSGEPSPVSDAANQLAEDALTEAQVRVIVTRPVIELDGPSARATAGAVLIAVGEGSEGFAVLVGGASAVSGAAEGIDVAVPARPAVPDVPADAASGSPARPPTPVARPPSPPEATAPPAATPTAPPDVATSGIVALLGEANPLWLGLAGAVFGGWFAAALRRLGLGILDRPIACDIGGQP